MLYRRDNKIGLRFKLFDRTYFLYWSKTGRGIGYGYSEKAIVRNS